MAGLCADELLRLRLDDAWQGLPEEQQDKRHRSAQANGDFFPAD